MVHIELCAKYRDAGIALCGAKKLVESSGGSPLASPYSPELRLREKDVDFSLDAVGGVPRRGRGCINAFDVHAQRPTIHPPSRPFRLLAVRRGGASEGHGVLWRHKHGMPAVAITDTGNLFGALEFSDAMMDKGIQPIVGMSIKVDFA